MKQKYTIDDLVARPTNRQIKGGNSVAHTHAVEFVRPLTPQEQQKFKRLLISFYDVVYFSQHYGNGLRAEPDINFPSPATATYTLYQSGSSGSWERPTLFYTSNL